MRTYLVATIARYVLVDAENEDAAREVGAPALHELYADLRAKLGRDVPINICTVSGKSKVSNLSGIATTPSPRPSPGSFRWRRCVPLSAP